MVQRIGNRRKTRSLYTKNIRNKGKFSLKRYFQSFKEGDKVKMISESSLSGKGMPLFRFHGRVGTVAGKQGRCYLVSLKDGNKDKTLIIHPIHLQEM